MSRAPSNLLPSEPATVHMFTHSHCTNTPNIPRPHMLSNKSSWLCHHTESWVINPASRCLRTTLSSFFTLTADKCWSRGSLSRGGESVMLITWQIPPYECFYGNAVDPCLSFTSRKLHDTQAASNAWISSNIVTTQTGGEQWRTAMYRGAKSSMQSEFLSMLMSS